MISDLEERLTSTLARAAEEAPVPGADPLVAVRARQRRRRRRRATLAAACAVAVVAVSAVTGTRLSAPQPKPDPGLEYAFSPDRIPDFTNLPDPEKLWPDAVHKLPGTLPDGTQYTVAAVLGDGRYLVTRGWLGGKAEPAPSVFDTRAGTVRTLGTSALTDGFAPTLGVLMAREVDGQAVWFVEGSRNNNIGREVWAAPLDGGPARHLADLADGASPRFSVAGDAIIWEQQGGGTEEFPDSSILSVSLDGGAVVGVPNSKQSDLTFIAPWIKNQHRGTGTDPRTSGELRNVVTGARVPWKAAPGIQNVRCGPTWCTGDGSNGRLALQSPDGTNLTELRYGGDLSQTNGGRLAVGYLQLPTGTLQVVWDRTTGKAAGAIQPVNADTRAAYRPGPMSSDYEPELLTLDSTKDQQVLLDLTAIN